MTEEDDKVQKSSDDLYDELTKKNSTYKQHSATSQKEITLKEYRKTILSPKIVNKKVQKTLSTTLPPLIYNGTPPENIITNIPSVEPLENKHQIKKQTQLLECRYEKATQKFNQIILDNRKLRVIIENIRKEKAIFDAIYSKLSNQLKVKQRSITEIVSFSNREYKESREMRHNIEDIIEENEQEQEKIKEKTIVKTPPKAEKKQKLKFKLKPLSPLLESRKSSLKAPSNKSLHAPLRKVSTTLIKGLSWGSSRKRMFFEEALIKMQSSTGLNPDQVIENFLKAEDEVQSLVEF